MSTTLENPQLSEVFPDADTHVASVRNTTSRPVYFLVVPTPGAKGLVVFRGKQHEDHYSAHSTPTHLPRLPHAVPVGGESSLLSINFDGELEVCRSMENGSVVVVASLGEAATEKAAAEHSKLSGTKVTPHPYFCLPPLQLTAGLILYSERTESSPELHHRST